MCAVPSLPKPWNAEWTPRAYLGLMGITNRDVRIPANGLDLPGTLSLPKGCRGFVLFAHGSGSSRHSPRNQAVARVLQEASLGTLLFDLLTDDEAQDRSLVFNISFLAERLLTAARWAAGEGFGPVGYFGASTGAGAALLAAAEPPFPFAVVSRGGRPDLAMADLPRVKAPTLLLVGSLDTQVIPLNQMALDALVCEKKLIFVTGATHLFEEPGCLEVVAERGRDWFRDHLPEAPDDLQ